MNICHADGIPQPEDISVQQLTEILASETPSNYKVPMSITELRSTPDKSGKDALVCDVAIHPAFFRKIEVALPFRDFLMTIIFEALEVKYNAKINRDTWIRLKNRKCMGTLVKHRIQNRDVRQVFESYQKPTKEQKTLLNEMQHKTIQEVATKKLLIEEITPTASGAKLIEEIIPNKSGVKLIEEIKPSVDSDDTSSSKDPSPTKDASPIKKPEKNVLQFRRLRKPDSKEPLYNLFEHTTNDEKKQLIVEFFLPDIVSAKEFILHLNRERVVLEARRANYLFDMFVPYDIDLDKSIAKFDNDSHVSCAMGRISVCCEINYSRDFPLECQRR